jgi:two-component system sensor histidine kinase TctE
MQPADSPPATPREPAARTPLLRTQLFRWLLFPLLALLALDAIISYHVANGFAQRAYDRTLVEIARELSIHVRSAGGSLSLDMPEAARQILFEDSQDEIYFELADREGRLVEGAPIDPPPAGARGGRNGGILYDGEIDGHKVRTVQMRLPEQEGAIVRVAETRVKRNEMTTEILASVILPQILLILLATSLVWIGVTRGLAPLAHLQRAIATRSHLDRSPLEERGVPGEVRPLVTSINALLARLDDVLTLQARFIGDAAHQLKTPVAGLQAQVELLARHPAHPDLGGITARLNLGVERLSRLVSQLLSLARNEPDAVRSLSFTPTDLNAMALDVASQWVPVALKRDIDLGFEASDEPVIINGDASRLRELFDNLLDNAVRYSREGGRVTVRVSNTPTPTVSISDDGPRIPEAERPRVFERFHRLLGTGDGSGLGLAIAREIAALHDATIVLRDDDYDGEGNIFSVHFPGPVNRDISTSGKPDPAP